MGQISSGMWSNDDRKQSYLLRSLNSKTENFNIFFIVVFAQSDSVMVAHEC
jgi:hypothetical protein